MKRGRHRARRLIIGAGAMTMAFSAAPTRDEWHRLEEEAHRAARLADQYEARARISHDQADQAEDQAKALAARVQQAEARRLAVSARLAAIESALAQGRHALAGEQEDSARLIATVQSFARQPTALALLRPGDLQTLVHARAVLAAWQPVIDGRTATLRALLMRQRARRVALRAAMMELKDTEQKLRDARNAFGARALIRRQDAVTEQGVSASEVDRALRIAEAAQSLGQAVIEAERDAQTATRLARLPGPLPRPGQSGGAPSPLSPPANPPLATPQAPELAYRLPVIGRLVSGFGEPLPNGRRTRGIVLAPVDGAIITTPCAGRIAYAARYRGYGLVVIIDHGGDWLSVISGLATANVAAGDQVAAGAPLGTAPDSGPRIEIEVRHNGRPIDLGTLLRR